MIPLSSFTQTAQTPRAYRKGEQIFITSPSVSSSNPIHPDPTPSHPAPPRPAIFWRYSATIANLVEIIAEDLYGAPVPLTVSINRILNSGVAG